MTGDYNKTTTVTKQGVEEAAGRIASGVATLTKDTFADGSIIKVGDKEYTVTTDAAKKGDADTIYVGDLALDTADGLAKRTLALCKEAGVVMTSAGATFPNGIDPRDRNIRIAPSLPPVAELEAAIDVFCVCLRLAALEKLLGR